MPQHSSQDPLIKFNSHLGFVNHEEIDPKNRNYDYLYDESHLYEQVEYFRTVIPMGVIFRKDGNATNPVETIGGSGDGDTQNCENYKFHSDMKNQFTTTRNYRPHYLLSFFEDTVECRGFPDASKCKLGLIRLGKVGCGIDSSKIVILKHEYLNNCEELKCCDTFFLYHVVVVDDGKNDSNIVKLMVLTPDLTWLLTVCLDQKIVEQSIVRIEMVNQQQQHSIRRMEPSRRYCWNFKLPTLNIENYETTMVSLESTIVSAGQREYCLRLFKQDGEIVFQKAIEQFTKNGHSCYNRTMVIPCVVSKGKGENDELFIIEWTNEIKIVKVTFSLLKSGEIEENVEPQCVQQFLNIKHQIPKELHFSKVYSTICQLTSSKYLILSLERKYFNNYWSSFQDFFINGAQWCLIDFDHLIIKRVYPRVYELEDFSKLNLNDFSPVVKKQKGRKFHKGIKNRQEIDDGDLNGGYSNRSLLNTLYKGTCHQEEGEKDSVKKSSNSMEPIQPNEMTSLHYSRIFSFRPFAHSPDLFQVHFHIPDYMSKSYGTRSKVWDQRPHYHGKWFKFYFRFRDEAIVTLGNMNRICDQFADVTFYFC